MGNWFRSDKKPDPKHKKEIWECECDDDCGDCWKQCFNKKETPECDEICDPCFKCYHDCTGSNYIQGRELEHFSPYY